METAGKQLTGLTPGMTSSSPLIDRRGFLRRAGWTAAAGVVLPQLPGTIANATTPVPADPDDLFTAGRFAAADRGYAQILHRDPRNARALAQRGRIALLSNRFASAERFLTEAVRLEPSDTYSQRQLAECFVRQDQTARAVPWFRRTGDQFDAALATQYAGLRGAPYRISGAPRTRVPMFCVDPLPGVRAAMNGTAAQSFLIDTGGGMLSLTTETAQRLGLRALATSVSYPAGQTLETSHGVLDSFRLGDIVLHNVPVVWFDLRVPQLPDGTRPAGVIGTELLHHFLSTMDYAGQALVLRRKTVSQQQAFQRESAGGDRLPLWLAGDHIPCTLGSLNDHGPGVVALDTGAIGMGVLTTEQHAQRAGIEIDYANPIPAGSMTCYRIRPARSRLGATVGRDLPGLVGAWPWRQLFGFDTLAGFAHEFFKPYAITYDYTAMTFTITKPRTG